MAGEGKDKKRKAATASEPPQKKSKTVKVNGHAKPVNIDGTAAGLNKSPSSDSAEAQLSLNVSNGNGPAIKSKKQRKRAADFLDDEEPDSVAPVAAPDTETPDLKKSKEKRTKKAAAEPKTQVDNEREHSKSVKKSKIEPQPTEVELVASSLVIQTDQANKTSGNERPVNVEKSKKSKRPLKADGANGVTKTSADENVEPISVNGQVPLSMQTEAQQTTEHELEVEFGRADEAEDQGAALLAGFDSDGEDIADDQNFDPSKPPLAIPSYKKTSKKLRKALEKGNQDGPGTVYVGRIPHGFYERQMRDYFVQFGPITKLRLSRNRTTGASKHFAFIEFESNEVAKIVAETMDNYLMFGHILKCKYALQENLHPDLWKGANKRFKRVPYDKIERQRLEAPKTKTQWERKIEIEQKKRDAKAEQLKKLGYEIEMPKIKGPQEVLEKRKLAEAEKLALPEAVAGEKGPVGALIPPPTIPKDEATLSHSEKPEKKQKKQKQKLEVIKPDPASTPNLTKKKAKASREAGAKSQPESETAKQLKAQLTGELIQKFDLAAGVGETAPKTVDAAATGGNQQKSKRVRKSKTEAPEKESLLEQAAEVVKIPAPETIAEEAEKTNEEKTTKSKSKKRKSTDAANATESEEIPSRKTKKSKSAA